MPPSEEKISPRTQTYPEAIFTFEQYLALEDEADYKFCGTFKPAPSSPINCQFRHSAFSYPWRIFTIKSTFQLLNKWGDLTSYCRHFFILSTISWLTVG